VRSTGLVNKERDLRRIIKIGLALQSATGIVLAVVCGLIANFIAVTVFNKPESAFLIIVASFLIPFMSLSLYPSPFCWF